VFQQERERGARFGLVLCALGLELVVIPVRRGAGAPYGEHAEGAGHDQRGSGDRGDSTRAPMRASTCAVPGRQVLGEVVGLRSQQWQFAGQIKA
jgi:hypothetical protein